MAVWSAYPETWTPRWELLVVGWSMGWVWFFWSPAWWRYRYVLLGGYHRSIRYPVLLRGVWVTWDWWAASAVRHPSQRAHGGFPPHPQRSSPWSVIADRTVEPPHGGWLPGGGLRIGTEGKYNWPCVGRRWVRYELSHAQVHPAEWAWGSKIPQSLKSAVFRCDVTFWTDIVILKITTWIESSIKISVLQKRKLRLMICLRVWFQSVFSILLYPPEQKFSENRAYLLTELVSKELLIITRSQGTAYHCFCLFLTMKNKESTWKEKNREKLKTIRVTWFTWSNFSFSSRYSLEGQNKEAWIPLISYYKLNNPSSYFWQHKFPTIDN